jgi:hypothetical protein
VAVPFIAGRSWSYDMEWMSSPGSAERRLEANEWGDSLAAEDETEGDVAEPEAW